MEKQVIIFTEAVPKKHSVCYKTKQADAAPNALADLYVEVIKEGRR